MRALVSVDRLEIHDVTDDAVLVRNPVAAVHVARRPCDVERLATVVPLDEADRLGRECVRVEQTPRSEARVQAERDLGLHVGELFLDELRLRSEEHTSELQSLMRISYAVFCLKK